MTFAAKQVRVFKSDQLSVTERKQIVALIRMVTIQAPDTDAPVVQSNVPVHQQVFPAFEIHREVLFRPVTRAARSNGLGQRRERHGEFLFSLPIRFLIDHLGKTLNL